MTFSVRSSCAPSFKNQNTGEIKEQTVFMGDFPMMTEKGTFVINGTERVVSQLVRARASSSSPVRVPAPNPRQAPARHRHHPSYRGEWIEFDVEQKPGKDDTPARVARKRRLGPCSSCCPPSATARRTAPGSSKPLSVSPFLEGQWEK